MRVQPKAKPSSDRSFGYVFAGVFAVIGLWPIVAGATPRWWAFAPAGIFLLAALVRPSVLHPLNRAWTFVGLALHAIVTPIVLGILYFGVFAPIAVLLRSSRNAPLSLRFDPSASSYWIHRTPPGPDGDSMKRQF